jgi:V/A-type H+-transporting ATPase subunit I
VAIISMSKIAVLGLETERKPLLEALMAMGVVQITDSFLDEDSSPDIQKPQITAAVTGYDNVLSNISAALETLRRYVVVKKPMFSIRDTITRVEFSKVLSRKEEILDRVAEINALENEIMVSKSEENRYKSMLLSLEPWLELDIPLDVSETRTTSLAMGTVPANLDLSALTAEMTDQYPEAALIQAGSDLEHQYLAVVVYKPQEADAMTFLKGKGFNRTGFRDMSGTAKENQQRILDLIAQNEKQRESSIEKIKVLASHRKDIEILSDAFKMERSRIEAAGNLVATKAVFMLKGWLPAEMSDKVKTSLEKKFLCNVQITEPEKDEETPVLVENGPVSESIQPVINMYGVPSSKEIDPSGTTLFFFSIFFGLIIADAGYGLLLAIGSGLVLRLFKMEAGTKRFIKLIFICGLATVFWGVMLGGYFGIESLAQYALWFNTGAPGGTEQMMAYCLLFGVIHLYAGHFMKVLNLLRRKLYLDIVFDVIFPVVMYTGFAMFILPSVPGVPPDVAANLSAIGGTVFLIGLILTVATAGRSKKGILGKVFGGLPKVYDVIAFLGDALSYLRLLALSLSGAILAGLINGMASGGGLLFKLTAGLLVLLLGHGINFAMGILGAFVHSCRLQYLEFFSKFLEGGGEAFRPFRANTQYVIIKQEDESL